MPSTKSLTSVTPESTTLLNLSKLVPRDRTCLLFLPSYSLSDAKVSNVLKLVS